MKKKHPNTKITTAFFLFEVCYSSVSLQRIPIKSISFDEYTTKLPMKRRLDIFVAESQNYIFQHLEYHHTKAT